MHLPALVDGVCGFNLGKLACLGGHGSLCLIAAILFALIYQLLLLAQKFDQRLVGSHNE
jgi:hypothetical protein